MRPTNLSRAMLGRSTPKLDSHFKHYFVAYQRIHEHTLLEVSGPGTPDPRSKYWWRRAYTMVMGPYHKFFYRDNIFPEEQSIMFKDPVPGGHGDRFTHSFAWWPGPNADAMYALKKWEMQNLTPEQLATKYGVYVPRHPIEDRIGGFLIMTSVWLYLFIMTYYDPDTGFVTHPVLDDFVRELGGITPLRPGEEYLDQWVHPWYHTPYVMKDNPRYTWKPLVQANTAGH
eukprot:TRINITY_DN3301_c0_g1_i1.p1 TRINITY_DN3301_c0_g1~~TRINITY_DN3301_c0_g1_i1.p1  ORF type:complete len:228 (+),score=9.02 TRINITY_DN3301_c0_g1_i1:53-736(+)